MPSTYTVNLGIEKPATGEQSGTWGDTTNVNFDILDQAVNGAARVTLTSAGSSGSPNTLQITNGATSDGRNKWIEFYSSGDLGGSVYVQLDPNDAEKIVFVRNSLASSRSVILFQGTYNSARDLEVPAGVDMVVKFDGGGASAATVTDVFTKLRATEITTPTLTAGTADINGGTVDGAVIGGSSAAAITGTTVTANTSLNIAGDGATVTGIKDEDNMASNSATKLATQQSIKAYVDSQVGTVDTWAEVLANGATSGSTNPEVTAGQALKTNTINETSAGSGVTIDSVLLKDDVVNATDIETGSISANDGTAAATIANSTGNFTITNFISNSVDIGGGAIDGTVIGGSSAAAGSFTTGLFTGVVKATAGSVGAPSITNSADINTGLYWPGDDQVGFAVGGSRKFYISSTQAFFQNLSSGVSLGGGLVAEGGAVFNEGGADVNFRVETNSHSHAFYIDGDTDNVGINQNNPQAQLHILGTNATNGATIKLQENNNNTTDNLGTILFGNNVDDSLARVQGYTHTDSTTSALYFGSTSTGTNVRNLDLLHNTAIFNENGDDIDFRVESNSNSHMLFVNAGDDTVVIGSGSISVPSTYHFISYGSGSGARSAFVHGAGDGGIVISGAAGGSAASVIFGNNWGSNGATFSEEWRLYMNGADDTLQFNHSENATKTMVLTPASKVGINEPSPDYHLHVNSGSTNVVAKFESTDSTSVIQFVDSTGNSEFGTTGSTARISPNGSYAVLEASQSAVVLNNASQDTDFRVESNAESHAIFVDAGNDRLGLFSSSPTAGYKVSVGGGAFNVIDDNAINRITSTAGYTVNTGGTGNIFRLATMSAHGARARARVIGSVGYGDPGVHEFTIEMSIGNADDEFGVNVYRTGDPINQHRFKQPNAEFDVYTDKVNDSSFDVWVKMGHFCRLEFFLEAESGTTARFDNSGTSTLPGTAVDTNTKSQYIMFADDVRITTQNDAQTDLKQNVNFDFDGAVFNENSNDLDFRVESDSNSHMLFVDAGNSRVGIGDSAPDVALSVVTGGSNEQFHVQSPTPGMKFIDSSLTTRYFTIGGENGNVAIHADPGSAQSSSHILMKADGSTIARFDGDGLKFGSDTAAANALDDYEEGTWTPTIFNGTVTYTAQRGRYTKIGRVVYIHCFIQIASISGANSTNIVAGLPFTSKNDGNYPALASKTNGFDYGGSSTMCTFQVVPNTTHIAGVGSGNNQSFRDLNSSGLSANDWIAFSGHYVTDS